MYIKLIIGIAIKTPLTPLIENLLVKWSYTVWPASMVTGQCKPWWCAHLQNIVSRRSLIFP